MHDDKRASFSLRCRPPDVTVVLIERCAYTSTRTTAALRQRTFPFSIVGVSVLWPEIDGSQTVNMNNRLVCFAADVDFRISTVTATKQSLWGGYLCRIIHIYIIQTYRENCSCGRTAGSERLRSSCLTNADENQTESNHVTNSHVIVPHRRYRTTSGAFVC